MHLFCVFVLYINEVLSTLLCLALFILSLFRKFIHVAVFSNSSFLLLCSIPLRKYNTDYSFILVFDGSSLGLLSITLLCKFFCVASDIHFCGVKT